MRKFFYILFLSFFFSFAFFAQDQKMIDSLKTVLKNNSLSDHQKAFALSRLGWHVSYYDLNEGLKYAEEGFHIAQKNNDLTELGDAANVIGTIYMDLGNYHQAIHHIQPPQRIQKSIGRWVKSLFLFENHFISKFNFNMHKYWRHVYGNAKQRFCYVFFK